MSSELETRRIRDVYSGHLRRAREALYAWHRPDVQWNTYRLRAVAAQLFRRAGKTDLATCRVLDVGCGKGEWLRTLIDWGIDPQHVHGVDLIPERITAARERSPVTVDLRVEDAMHLPYADGTMHMVTANTVFSSVLDKEVRLRIAREMQRVCAANGVILVYDFRIKDPRNPDTVAIGRSELVRLFPNCGITIRSLTLAPPLARRIAPWSMPLTAMLEWGAPFLRTHLLALIRPTNDK